jgi:hypothetical protein
MRGNYRPKENISRMSSELSPAFSEQRQNALESMEFFRGRVAQLAEHLLCKQGVAGSIPATSTNHLPANQSLP